MQLYTLSSRFLPKDLINQFTSMIWTERYFSAGDVQLVVPGIPSMVDLLAKGTMLGLRGTKEVMTIETQSIEKGLLTVTGYSLPKFLNERIAWFPNPDYKDTDTSARLSSEFSTDTLTAGQFVAQMVDGLVINPVPYGTPWTPINLDWPNEKIPGLQMGVVDANGAAKRLTMQIGPLYDSIQRLAQEEGLGIKLYLESSKYSGTYVLRFATYRGKDRTSDQTSNLLVRFSPKLDSLNDVKELNSLTNYKNVFYVSYKNQVTTHYIPGLEIPVGFDRRSVLIEAPDIYFDPNLPGFDAKVAAFREQVARNAIAEHFYIQTVDGQISAQPGYTFGVDYGLGDIIELEGFSGFLAKARVTEYIRSQDQFGEKEYPTLAVLDPEFIGYMPDLETDPNFETDWNEDPDFDFDIDPDDPAKDPRNDPETRPSPTPGTDPRDPVDYNPDPTYDFGDAGSGGDANYYEDYKGGELELHPNNEHTSGDHLSWYQHYDKIYLEGNVYYGSTGDPGGMITVAGSVPVEARPAVTTPITIYPDMPNSDALYGHFTTFQGEVTADGTIRLTTEVLPSDSRIELYLVLANISWPVNPPLDLPPDQVDQEALKPWLKQHLQFSDPQDSITATSDNALIGKHGLRVHLNGDVTLADPTVGNLLQGLPSQYQPPHKDWLVIPGGGGWFPAYVDQGSLSFKQQRSKPMLRGLNVNRWLLGDGLQRLTDIESSLSAKGGPIMAWSGPMIEEVPVYLQGRWSPPISNDIGTEFGFFLAYGQGAYQGEMYYKIAAQKMDAGGSTPLQWWLMLTIYNLSMENIEPALVYTYMPLVRLDTDYAPGELLNPISIIARIRPVNEEVLEVSANVRGTTYSVEWPQGPEVGEGLPIWPSQVGASGTWGAIATLVDGVNPVSELTDITGDYFEPSGANVSSYPPTWLPNHGYVKGGDTFNLDGVGWRVPS